jgi:hypothetical protein
MTRILLGAVALLVLVSLGLGWGLSRTLTKVGAVEVERDSYQQALSSYVGSLEKRDQLLAEREQERTQALQDARLWRQRWREAQRNDSDCETWASGGLPDCVVRLLQEPSTPRPEGNSTGGTTPANP